MTFIAEFPDDDYFWFVKWIDEPRYDATTPSLSVKVSVLIQRTNARSQDELDHITPHALHHEVLGLPFEAEAPVTLIVRISVGTMPLFGLGAVFHRREYTGQLPTSSCRLSLPGAEAAGTSMLLSQVLPSPASWTSNRPYHLLNRSEYAGILPRFDGSHVFVLSHGSTDYIFPRTEIFRRFYAPHTEMAHALTAGQWSDTKRDVILLGHDYAGLRTENLGHEWRLLLQTRVPDQYARWLAILHFDRFANACANKIYFMAALERDDEERKPWHFHALFPFRALETPLRLSVRGWHLALTPARPGQTNRQKFLVTSINGSNLPDPYPPIWFERYNSNLRSDLTEVEQADRQYGPPAPPPPQAADNDMVIDGAHDATTWKQPVFCLADTFAWIDAQPLAKLKKLTHRTFPAAVPLPHDGSPAEASTGISTNGADTLPKADIQTLVRGDPSSNFIHLEKAMAQLHGDGHLAFRVLEPPPSRARLIRGTLTCWSLPDWQLPQVGRRSLAWVMIRRKKKDEAQEEPPYPRAALVFAITHAGRTGYWVEVDAGHAKSACLSTVLYDVAGDPRGVIGNVMTCIAEAKGDNLSKVIPPMMRERGLGNAVCSKHSYDTVNGAKVLSDSWVRRFLRHYRLCG